MDKLSDKKNQQKRYYWLKLKNTYFSQLTQKKMKRQPDGKEMQIIYLRMMLLSIDKEGYIYYQGVYDTLEEELAEEFDEKPELVKKTINFLKENEMIVIDDNENCYIPEVINSTGSEAWSTERSRRCRERKNMLQCNTSATPRNDSENTCNIHETSCNEEIEKRDKRIELEKEGDTQEGKTPSCPRPSDSPPADICQRIMELYNTICISFPRMTKLSETRKKAIKARTKQYTIDDIEKVFRMAESSPFLKGGNDRNWTANFDWIIKDSNMAKILDGNYADKKPASKTGNTFNHYPQRCYSQNEVGTLERLLLQEGGDAGWKGQS